MNVDKFIEIFGCEGYDKRFDGLKAKGCEDLSNGYYTVYDNIVFYQYVDSKERIYESSKEPECVIDIDIKSTALKGIQLQARKMQSSVNIVLITHPNDWRFITRTTGNNFDAVNTEAIRLFNKVEFNKGIKPIIQY